MLDRSVFPAQKIWIKGISSQHKDLQIKSRSPYCKFSKNTSQVCLDIWEILANSYVVKLTIKTISHTLIIPLFFLIFVFCERNIHLLALENTIMTHSFFTIFFLSSTSFSGSPRNWQVSCFMMIDRVMAIQAPCVSLKVTFLASVSLFLHFPRLSGVPRKAFLIAFQVQHRRRILKLWKEERH